MISRPHLNDSAVLESSIQQARKHYDHGKFLDAWRCAAAVTPIQHWRGVQACLFGARLAKHLGAPKLSTRLIARARRLEPDHPTVQFYYGLDYLDYRGPIALWLTMRSWPPSKSGTDSEQADLLVLRARLSRQLRDFKQAESFLQQCENQGPSRRNEHIVQRVFQMCCV